MNLRGKWCKIFVLLDVFPDAKQQNDSPDIILYYPLFTLSLHHQAAKSQFKFTNPKIVIVKTDDDTKSKQCDKNKTKKLHQPWLYKHLRWGHFGFWGLHELLEGSLYEDSSFHVSHLEQPAASLAIQPANKQMKLQATKSISYNKNNNLKQNWMLSNKRLYHQWTKQVVKEFWQEATLQGGCRFFTRKNWCDIGQLEAMQLVMLLLIFCCIHCSSDSSQCFSMAGHPS